MISQVSVDRLATNLVYFGSGMVAIAMRVPTNTVLCCSSFGSSKLRRN